MGRVGGAGSGAGTVQLFSILDSIKVGIELRLCRLRSVLAGAGEHLLRGLWESAVPCWE